MCELANHIALFCSQDNTGYLVKYIDPVLGLDQNQGLHYHYHHYHAVLINCLRSRLE